VLGAALEQKVALTNGEDAQAGSEAVNGDVEHTIIRPTQPTMEQKERRRLAKRIVKAIQPGLEEGLRKEAELGGRPFAKELRELDMLLDSTYRSRRGSMAVSTDSDGHQIHEQVSSQLSLNAQPLPVDPEGIAPEQCKPENHTVVLMESAMTPSAVTSETSPTRGDSNEHEPPEAEAKLEGSDKFNKREGEHAPMDTVLVPEAKTNGFHFKEGEDGEKRIHTESGKTHPAPPTPPMSAEEDLLAPLSNGGIPWYAEQFDPVGTTYHEERWTGREVVRGMSEELSELDDAELRELTDMDMVATDAAGDVLMEGGDDLGAVHTEDGARRGKTKRGRGVRRWRGFR
jgi:NuA3 HAT complex component NTO1